MVDMIEIMFRQFEDGWGLVVVSVSFPDAGLVLVTL